MHLNDRRDLDQSRLTLLAEERQRLMAMLAAKKREVDMLEDETKRLKRNEAEEKLEKLQALMPARRV
jgi:predicted RNase H-like nuclease (RuvC/YqgF family)